MFQNLEVFQTAHLMAKHAGERQARVAENVANADTPGYKAKDIAPFREILSLPTTLGQRATRETHINGSASSNESFDLVVRGDASSPNGNTVSVEQQMLKAVDTKRQHDRAVAIYKSALDVLRFSLGKA